MRLVVWKDPVRVNVSRVHIVHHVLGMAHNGWLSGDLGPDQDSILL